METSNLPDAEFKTMVIRVVSELRERVDELSGKFSKEKGYIKLEIETIKNQKLKLC